ncbi:hypothetical protein LFT44_08460 [Arthrobacter sp. FW306-05-C]|uniref:hypothetical protein n=1 Tax=Arthrobacter sp. FW306-05-C TaxID=2879620 RepID=UPI001F2E6210|nr:hypothetical protein [Arthrobacter sp. FW306-05-C]UKA68399.1 hypothetical protein LFT44_08460 [Arthrobacter sp. FW306-05-C]
MFDRDESLQHQVPTSPDSRPRMPLSARRLMLVAAVGILLGILAGRFLFAGLILAAAGMTAVAVALSYRPGSRWFSPVTWVVCVAGALWTAATAGYWLTVTTAADAGQQVPAIASPLFYGGAGCLVIMAGGVVTAAVLRTLRARKTPPGA